MASTSVVLPWSTCAMMAMLRMPELKSGFLNSFGMTGSARRSRFRRLLLLYYARDEIRAREGIPRAEQEFNLGGKQKTDFSRPMQLLSALACPQGGPRPAVQPCWRRRWPHSLSIPVPESRYSRRRCGPLVGGRAAARG